MNETTWTPGQYAFLRMLFGCYLLVHFGYLIGYGTELFSSAGMLPYGALSPLFVWAPSLLHVSDAPGVVAALIASGAGCAVLFAVGRCDRIAGACMLLLLMSLFTRNPLIANPALPYVGFMLLAHLFIPRMQPFRKWQMPSAVPLSAITVLAISYSYSGYTKLLSPSWMAGDAVSLVLENPLARDWFVRDLFLLVPDDIIKALTWFILTVELLYAPLYLIPKLRAALWTAMLAVQFGFLLLLRFPDLTIPMLLFHVLAFDPRWLPARADRATLYYDGECGLCHRVVRWALSEVDDRLRFKPVQTQAHSSPLTTWWIDTEDGERLERSDAAMFILRASGGLWGLAAGLMHAVPVRPRDLVYSWVAVNRRRWFPRPEGLCPVTPPELQGRFL